MRNPKNIYNYIKTFNKKNKAKFNKSIFSFNYQRGISLIALVVTIAILMILAGITINVAFGENGILKSAEEFSNKVQNAQEQKNQELSNLLEELEETMMGGVEGLISPKITWSNEKATLTLSLEDTSYTLYYKTTNGEYTQYIEPIINLNHGDKIDVRLSKENKPDKTVTINIIDIQTPSATIKLSTNSTNVEETITATVIQTDNETGVNITDCKYLYNQLEAEIGTTSSAWNDATVFSNKTQTIELTANEKGSYYLHVLTIDKAGNKKETVSEEVIVEEVPGIGAEVIATADDKNAYYGKTVTNYTCENSAGVSAWKIFYADNSNIYLITSDVIEYRYVAFTTTADGTVTTNKPANQFTTYNARLWDILGDYAGSARITDTKIKNLNKKYFDYLTAQNTSSTHNGIKAVAYLLDTNAWSKFKGEDAEYAIGAPPLEMLLESYNQTHPKVDHMSRVIDIRGYQISSDYGNSWGGEYSGSGMLSSGKLYNINKSYWVASPYSTTYSSSYGTVRVVEGSRIHWCVHAREDGAYAGIRPVVCLNSDTRLQQLEDGNFAIIK